MRRSTLTLILIVLFRQLASAQCPGGAVWVGGIPPDQTLNATATAQGSVTVSVNTTASYASDRPRYRHPIVSYNGLLYRFLGIGRGGARAWNTSSTSVKFSQALDSNIVHFHIWDVRGDGLNAETQQIAGYLNGVPVSTTAKDPYNGGYLSGNQIFGSNTTTNSSQSAIRIFFNGPVDSVVLTRVSYGDYVNFDVYFKCAILLPFILKEFTATVKNSNTKLEWEVSESYGFSKFLIERSADSRQWKAIGAKEIDDFSGTTKKYSFLDESPVSGKNFYRLKTIDNDGSIQFSKIVAAVHSYKKTPVVKVLTNPLPNEMKLSIPNGNTTISIYSSDGKSVYQSKPKKGSFSISTSTWKPGIYYLRAITETGLSESHRLIKQ